MTVSDELLTVAEVAARLRVNEDTVRRWIKQRRIKAVKLGSDRSGYRVTDDELKRFIEAHALEE